MCGDLEDTCDNHCVHVIHVLVHVRICTYVCVVCRRDICSVHCYLWSLLISYIGRV